jgi:hypothetical protein
MKSLRRMLSVTLFSLILLGSFTQAQSVFFCESVDDDGHPIGSSSSFTIGIEGGYLYILTRLGYACDTYEIIIDIFKVDRNDRGTFKVYIYDEYSQLLASGEVDIKY